jgi:hypothetical protein
MSTRISALAALVAAMLFASGASTEASYTLSTSIAGVTYNGAAVSTTTIASGSTVSGPGFSDIATNGGLKFTDAAGSIVYILNDFQTANTIGAINVQVIVDASGATNGIDTGVLNFTTLISPNGSGSVFTETLNTNAFGTTGFQFLIGAGQFTILNPQTETIVPATITVGNMLFSELATGSTPGNANSSQNPTVGAAFIATTLAVPEPASIAMLGLGLVSLGGFALRRRMAK